MKKYLLPLITILLLCLTTFLSAQPGISTTRYVKEGGAGSQDGSSWANASGDLQQMINQSDFHDEIWVAGGTYYPIRKANAVGTITIDDRNNAFVLRERVSIYGGFAGTETSLGQRDLYISANESILSGNIGSPYSASDNAYHVVIAVHISDCELNGFTIEGGNANGLGEIFVKWSSFVNGVAIIQSKGGGLYNIADNFGTYTPTIDPPKYTNLKILNNNAAASGGGIYTRFSRAIMVNILLSGNTAMTGGGMINEHERPKLVNFTISGNSAIWAGGGMYNSYGTLPEIINCIVWGNTATQAGNDVYSENTNSPVISYSLIKGIDNTAKNGLDGTNPANNPQFFDPANGDYTLTNQNSPAVDAGSNQAYTYMNGVGLQSNFDIAGYSRLFNDTIDMGAYEFQTIGTDDNIIYVNKNVVGGSQRGDSWTNAVPELADALRYAKEKESFWTSRGIDSLQIFVAQGTYKPKYSAQDGSFGNGAGRRNTFLMVKNVQIYGGFDPENGIVDLTSNRLFPSDEATSGGTVLSGDIGTLNSFSDNTYHVVMSIGNVETAELNGLSIKDGNANGSGSISVSGIIASSNNGGGIYNRSSSPTLKNVVVSGNSVSNFGGGIYNDSASPILINVALSENTATSGGALYNNNSSPPLTNVTLHANSASLSGGGIHNAGTSFPSIINSIIWGNTSDNIDNNIHSGPTSILTLAYSLVQDVDNTASNGLDGNNPANAPQFFNPVNGDYTLNSTSPAVEAGSNAAYMNVGGNLQGDFDLAGNSRLFNETIDMGAYEFQTTASTNNIIYVNKNVVGGSGSGNSWENAIPELADALLYAKEKEGFWTSNGINSLQVYVAQGVYKPKYSPADGNFGSDDGRNNTFLMVKNVQIYGGFDPENGIVDLTSNRIFPSDEGAGGGTVLSGDIGVPNDADDNSYHVVMSIDDAGTAELNGLSIKNGNANGSGSISVSGLTAPRFHGGGMYNRLSSPTLRSLIISGNSVSNFGGGIYNAASSPTLVNVLLNGNTATSGGAMLNNNSSPSLTNITISGNSVAWAGGGIHNDGNSSPNITNSIVWGNSASHIGNNVYSVPTSSPNIAYSLVQDFDNISNNGVDGTNPALGSPFVDPVNGDFGLKGMSPAVDSGSNAAYVNAGGNLQNNIDLAGEPRQFRTTIDMGAYEFLFSQNENNILYVKKNQTGSGTGDSWENAISELADALRYAKEFSAIWSDGSNDSLQIFVASGHYKPLYSPQDEDFGNPAGRDNSFLMTNNVQLYGGFAGTESDLTERDLSLTENISVLSGDINDDDVISGSGSALNISNNGENNYHVVICSGNAGSALVDGFTISGGNANGIDSLLINENPVYRNSGGGIHSSVSSPSFNNLTLRGNSADHDGGGMYNTASSPKMAFVSLIENIAGQNGGAMYNTNSSPSLINTILRGNEANQNGGALHNSASSPSMRNVSITENSSIGQGGGVYNNSDSSPMVTNTTISQNTASEGDEWFNAGGNPIIRNSIIFGNGVQGTIVDREHSLVQGYELWRDGNINFIGEIDSLFIDPVNGDFNLRATSLAINRGNNQTYVASGGSLQNDVDIAENPRIYDGTPNLDKIDMGAYEFQGEPILLQGNDSILYVDKNVIGGDGSGSSWNNAFSELADALIYAAQQPDYSANNPLKIFVTIGTYKPLYSPEDGVNFGTDQGRKNTFLMVGNVHLYGGFDPNNGITDLTHERISPSIENITQGTVLSGDVNGDDVISGSGRTLTFSNNDENNYHVVVTSNPDGDVIIDGFTITGGFAQSSSTTTINSASIPNNDGAGFYGRGTYGGAIERTSFIDVILYGNYASNRGGGVCAFQSDDEFTNVILSTNRAKEGGGMYTGGNFHFLTNITLSENRAWEGGGLYNNSTLFMIYSTIKNNRADFNGGGIYNKHYAEFINLKVSNNSAGESWSGFDRGWGGGIFDASDADGTNYVNILITGNWSKGGAGFMAWQSAPTLINVTIGGNTSSEGTEFRTTIWTDAKVRNSIIYGNGADTDTDITFSNSIVQGRNDTTNGNIPYTGAVSGLFSDPVNGDYSLLATSPAVNAGSNTTFNNYYWLWPLVDDVAGNSRIYADTIDIGALEFQGSPTDYFITTWTTDNPGSSDNTSIEIPTIGSGYNYDVSWNNDGVWETGFTGNASHTYDSAGTYTVVIRGDFPRIYFNNTGDKEKILSIEQWGTRVWGSMQNAFYGCANLIGNSTDTPNLSNVTNMSGMFRSASNFNQDIGNWDVSNATNVYMMFMNASSFNQDISSWDVSNVTDMGFMFHGASAFNQEIGNWAVDNVTAMDGMFGNTTIFNADISNWNVGNVVDMTSMFYKSAFNQNIGNWDVSSVTVMTNMFRDASVFNQDISNWDVSNVTRMIHMFREATSFNQDIGNWNVSNVTRMEYMFFDASSFNQNLGNWDVSSVTQMEYMFFNASLFNQNLGNWNVSNLASADEMFDGVTLSIDNYEALLIGWNNLTLQTGVTFDGGNSQYCSQAAADARANMIATHGWNITDGGISAPVFSAIADVSVCGEFTLPPITGTNLSGDEKYYSETNGGGTSFNIGDVLSYADFSSYPATLYAYGTSTSGCGRETDFALTIHQNDISGVTFQDITETYDGAVHSITVAGLPIDASVTYTNNDQAEAGIYEVTALVSSANSSCPNLELTATLTINKAQAAITAASPQTFTYDGTVKSITATLNNAEGTLIYAPQQGYTDVGTYSITVSAAETNNYLASSESVSLVIEPASQSGIVFADETFTYDGTEHSIFVDNLPTGATVVYQNNGQTNAGTYEVTATVSQDNYADTVLTADLIINKTQAIITAVSPQTFTYDGTLKNVIASLNDAEGTLSYAPQQGYTEVGTYPITVSSDETANYLAASENVSLVIEPASQSEITFADGTFTYDGTEHSIVVDGLPVDATVVYQNNGQTNAGTYEVTATISQDNYADTVLTADLIINKTQAIITAVSPQTFTYDGTLKNVIATLDNAEGTLTYAPQQGYTDVGTYTITISSDETANYLAASENVSLVIDPASQSGITFADGTFTYDGTEHSIFVSNLPVDATVVYQNNGQIDVGTYEVTATVSQDNYADEVLTADLIINKAQPIITAVSPQTFTYDGTVKNITATLDNAEGMLTYAPQQGYIDVGTYSITVSSDETANYLAATENVSLVIEPASQSGITFADGTFTYDGNEHSIFVSNLPADATVVYQNNGQVDAGTYEVTATVSQDNYADTMLTADLVINKAQAVITAVSPQTFTYDGTVKNITATLNNAEGTLTYAPQQGYTDVGTYAITVSSDETANYFATSENVSLVIEPASQSGITFVDGTFTYDGTGHSIFVSNLPVEATVVYQNNGQVDAGTYEVTATVSQDNYADEVLTADLIINKAQAVITAVSPQTFTYDGTVKNITASLDNAEGTLIYAPQQGYTDVGTYAITVSSDETSNYLAASENVSLVIEPASQSGIIFADGTFTYDGNEHSIFVSNLPVDATVVYQNNGQVDAGTYEVTATVSQDNYADEVLTADLIIIKAQPIITAVSPQTFVYDGTVKNITATLNNTEGTLIYAPQQGYTNVGTYAITVSSDETANYLAASQNVSLVIEPASQSEISFVNGTFTYDGLEHSIFVSNLPVEATVVYQNNGQIDAGTYEVTVTVSQNNYADELLMATLTINKAQAVITAASPQTFTYDGTVKNITATLNNTEGSLTYAPQQGYTDVGTYSITVSSDETANYLAASEVVSLVIVPASQSGITFADGTFTYDGTEHSIFVSNLPVEATVVYQNNGQVDAGTYEVTATVSQDNYADEVLTADLIINKAQPIITAVSPQTFVYDGTVKNITATLDNAEGTLSYAPQQGYTDVGTYSITVSSDETANYLAASEVVSLVIVPASQSGITFADGTFTYDGTEHSIFVSNLPVEATVVYQNNGQVDAGTYEVTATVSQDNYADEVLTADLIINKAQAIITAASPQTFTYDGTVKNITATLDNAEGTLTYAPQQGYTDVGTYAITVSSDETANYLAASEVVSLVIDLASQSGITFADGTFTYDGTEHSIFVSNLPVDATVVYQNNGQIDVGTYEVTATISQDNYADEVLTADLIINKAQAVITAVSPQTFTYDGTVQNIIATLDNAEGMLIYAPQQGYTDVGTYAITVSSDETANYLAATENVSLVIEPASQSGITFADGTFTYDGTEHSIFMSNLPVEATVVYQNNGQIDAGTYEVTATVSQDNYADEVLTADLIINKAQAIITAVSPQTFTYDGTVKNITATLDNAEGILTYAPQQGYTDVGTYSITVSSDETANYLAASEVVSLVIDPASQSGITFADGTFTYDGLEHSIFVSNLPMGATVAYSNNGRTDAGTYEVTATVSQDNYADTMLTADLVINKAQAVITAVSPQTFTYDGTVQNITATLNNAEGMLTYAPQQGYTDVGTYAIAVSSDETANYLAASENVSLVIEPASQSGITFAYGTFTYDGTEHSIFVSNLPVEATVVYQNNGQIDAGTYEVTATVSQDNYADEVLIADLIINKAQAVITAASPQTFTYDGTVKNITASLDNAEGTLIYAPQQGYTDVGTYAITVSAAATNNYLAASENVSLVIEPASQSGITFADGTFTYDGTAHSIFVSNLPVDATVVYQNNGQIDAGTYEVTATVSQDNYADEVLTADLIINKAQAIITAASPQTFTYDGTVKNITASLNSIEGTLSYAPQQGYSDVGTYAITVSSDETNNYLAASENVSLVIEPASQSGITFADGTFTYDGLEHSIFVSNLPMGATVAYSNNGHTDAGTYEVTATVSQDNYADTMLTADLVINKAQAVITAVSPQTFTYDGTVQNITATLNNAEGMLTYAPQQGYTDVGTYAIAVSFDETANYLAATENVSLVIEPASQSGIIFADGTFTYDGNEHSIFVSNLPVDATVVYQNNGQIDAGTYEVTATVSQDNYADEVLTADLIINKAQAIITAASPQAFTYDGTVKNVTASLDNAEGTLSYAPQQGYTDVGTYSITVSSDETANYLAATENVSLVIEPASQSGIIFADGTFTYDGNEHSIFVSNLPVDATVVYQNNGQIDAGTYEVTATVSQDNYADEVLTADLIINKAQAIITAASPQAFTYDGTVKNITATLDNAEGTLTYAPHQGYTDVGTYAITVSSDETSNYLAASENVSLVIEPASQSGITFADGTFTYDGTEHSIFVSNLPVEATVVYQNNGQIDAGTYEVTATVSQDNYADEVLTADLIINKAQAIITAASPQTFTYDGTVKNITATLDNAEGTLSYAPQQGYTDVGTYAITVSSDETANYLAASENVSLVIEPASQSGITFVDGMFTYDGLEHSIFVSNLPAEATVVYQNNGQINAGTYEVTATVSQDNYADEVLTADLIINKAQPIITAVSPQTFTYDGTVKNITATLDNAEGILTYAPQQGYTDVGTYSITVSSDETNNYLSASENVSLVIEPASQSGYIEANLYGTAICGERNVTISIYNTDYPELNDVYTTTINTNSNITTPEISAGTYSVLIKFDGYLAKLFHEVIIESGGNSLNISGLINGDIDNNNKINIYDFSLLSSLFGSTIGDGTYNPLADFNCDGSVNIFDVSIISPSYGLQGDSAPVE